MFIIWLIELALITLMQLLHTTFLHSLHFLSFFLFHTTKLTYTQHLLPKTLIKITPTTQTTPFKQPIIKQQTKHNNLTQLNFNYPKSYPKKSSAYRTQNEELEIITLLKILFISQQLPSPSSSSHPLFLLGGPPKYFLLWLLSHNSPSIRSIEHCFDRLKSIRPI